MKWNPPSRKLLEPGVIAETLFSKGHLFQSLPLDFFAVSKRTIFLSLKPGCCPKREDKLSLNKIKKYCIQMVLFLHQDISKQYKY